ncbi:hypothetical protein ACFY7Y_14500 [Streptomyces virginiae]|uniref:hypothetical protein n=1 Tax=Streptomyces virginiae TaxID=1961 RepID=UPI003679C422
MTTHSMRPAVALAWILGTLLLTRPEIANAAMAALTWTLTAPAGAWILGAAFIAAIAFAVRSTQGWAR